MSGRTVASAILLLVAGNLLAISSDVVVKGLGPDVPVFQFVFMRSLASLLLMLPFLGQLDRKRLFQGFRIHLARAHLSLLGISCMVIALNALPLATANALFYAAPLLVLVLSVGLFSERMTWQSLLAVTSGFAGILVILRPVVIDWRALSAFGVATALAVSAVLVRKLPRGQPMIQTLFVTYILILPGSLLLALWRNEVWHWHLMIDALASSFFILGYNMTVLRAYRTVDANQVTSAEYTGLVWAVLAGWAFFGEMPGPWFFVGTAMIVLPLILVGLRARNRARKEPESAVSPPLPNRPLSPSPSPSSTGPGH